MKRTEKTEKTEKRYLTIEQVAQLTTLKKSYIYKCTHTRTIPHIKMGSRVVFDYDDIVAWMESNKVLYY